MIFHFVVNHKARQGRSILDYFFLHIAFKIFQEGLGYINNKFMQLKYKVVDIVESFRINSNISSYICYGDSLPISFSGLNFYWWKIYNYASIKNEFAGIEIVQTFSFVEIFKIYE